MCSIPLRFLAIWARAVMRTRACGSASRPTKVGRSWGRSRSPSRCRVSQRSCSPMASPVGVVASSSSAGRACSPRARHGCQLALPAQNRTRTRVASGPSPNSSAARVISMRAMFVGSRSIWASKGCSVLSSPISPRVRAARARQRGSGLCKPTSKAARVIFGHSSSKACSSVLPAARPRLSTWSIGRAAGDSRARKASKASFRMGPWQLGRQRKRLALSPSCRNALISSARVAWPGIILASGSLRCA